MTPRAERLVVLDLDDTLFLERDFVRSGFRAVSNVLRRKHGITGFFTAAWRRFISGERGLIFNGILAEKGLRLRADEIRGLVRTYRTHRPAIRLCPDARRLLESPPSGWALAILSDGPLTTQRNKIRALGLAKAVNAIVLTDRWGRRGWKPSPRGFRLLQTRFRLHGERCVYVGDNPLKDFDAPLRLGWKAIRLRRPGGLHFRLPCPSLPEATSLRSLQACLT